MVEARLAAHGVKAPTPTAMGEPADPSAILKADRDRYVAFAFAAADLLIELDDQMLIKRATGAARSIVGRSLDALVGVEPSSLAAPADRPLMRRLLRKIATSGRVDPAPIRMDHPPGNMSAVMFGGCAIPSLPGSTFLSLTVMPQVAAPETPRDTASGLLTKDGLLDAASRATKHDDGKPKHMTLVQLDGLSGAVRDLPKERANLLLEEIGASMRALSVGGDAAARLGDEQFGLVAAGADRAATEASLMGEIADVVKAAGVRAGVIGPRIATVDLAATDLSLPDAAKSIAYAVNKFCKSDGADFAIGSLKDGLEAALAQTMERYTALRRIIDDENFTLVFQPIVDLGDRHIHHYEALSRFADGRNPFETITFSEQIGVVQELDLAVCKRAIAALEGDKTVSLAVNMSGGSIQNDQFRAALSDLVGNRRDLRTRLLFELTESSAVEEMEEPVQFLRWLRRLGFSVCLDDFGAGAAAYGYLRQFDVDYVKIDGPFLRASLGGQRERALIRSICGLCRELGSAVIGEMIEDEPMSAMARSLGIEFGQGYLFGKPSPTIQPAGGARVIRRKGVKEDWG